MDIIARYPKHNRANQQYFIEQLNLIKCRISEFKSVCEEFNNFTIYDTVLYHECHNIILRSLIDNCFNLEPNVEKIKLLEDALHFRKMHKWIMKDRSSFKKRITSCCYSKSRSAFQEISIMYRIGLAVGSENIEFEATIPKSKKNSDICVSLNGLRKIYLEISSVNRSMATAEQKLQEIFDDAAQYLHDKIPNRGYKVSMTHVDTSKLVFDADDHIDRMKSKTMMRNIVDQICIDQLSIRPLQVHTPEHQDFAIINKKNICGSSSVWIQSNNMYYSPPTTADPVAYAYERASLGAIQRTIDDKAKKHQYESDHPAILVIYWNPSTRDYESNIEDFSYIKNKILEQLRFCSELSGVYLFSSDDHTKGKFIYNPEANDMIKVSESEVNLLFHTVP